MMVCQKKKQSGNLLSLIYFCYKKDMTCFILNFLRHQIFLHSIYLTMKKNFWVKKKIHARNLMAFNIQCLI